MDNIRPLGRISFLKFKRKFQQIFRLDYPEEDNSEPSMYALRAFDTIIAMKRALKKLNTSTSTSTVLMETLLSTNFTGLSGLINFQDRELILPSALKIVNVVGKKYKEIGVWSSKHGFSRSVDPDERKRELEEKNLDSPFNLVTWPGNLKRIPKAWSMPSEAKKMRIAVPGRTSFEKFVKVTKLSSNRLQYSGFCIEVFNEVLNILKDQYPLPYEFSPFYGSYDELVQCVANKTFDAAVGDVTILANRSEYVEFTQPFTESWLTMVVPVESQAQNQAWIFVKPFTGEMWAITGAILLYTVLIVWLLEREINPEFEGRWWNQLNTALWFTCSSLFFAHRERIYNNYTRIIVVVWLFVVLALTSSYTASLSSLLTVPRLVPSVTDIQWLKDNNAKIGCDGDSFIRKYLEDVLHFRPENIRNINSQKDYPKEFESGNIAAAFLELPYEKAFLSLYCKGYTVVGNTSGAAGDRFGGLGFVFQKGSPIVDDVSRAILSLSENGRLKQLELKYFSPSPGCSETSDAVDSLNWRSFWGLYLFSAGTSTVCGVVYYLHRFYGWLRLR